MNLNRKTSPPPEGLSIESLMELLFYRDEFLSLASHELKTPLTSLKLHAQVFKRQSKKNNSDSYSKEKVDALVEQVDSQANRLMKLIDMMLDISRIRSGNLSIVKERFNLTELVENIFNAELNNERDIINIQKGVLFFGDKHRIEQVIFNILDNALKYGKNLPIEVKLAQKKNKILLSITDHGYGIIDEDRKKIFHRFQRAVPASEVSGLGLGLYIAKEIVEAHGGKIRVKSEIEKGSTFTVELKTEGAT